MLNYIWSGLIIVSVVFAALLNNTSELSDALVNSGASSIQLLMTMAGIICLWSGIMKIAEESRLTQVISKAFAPLLKPLFSPSRSYARQHNPSIYSIALEPDGYYFFIVISCVLFFWNSSIIFNFDGTTRNR